MNLHNYKITFSWIGFVAFLLPMIPNIIWAVLPRESDFLTMYNVDRPILDTVEKIAQGAMIVLLLLVVNKEGAMKPSKNPVLILTIICLGVYLVSWIVYCFGTVNPVLILSLAVVPSLYFILFAVYQRNYYAMCFGVIFGVAHTIISCLNYIVKK